MWGYAGVCMTYVTKVNVSGEKGINRWQGMAKLQRNVRRGWSIDYLVDEWGVVEVKGCVIYMCCEVDLVV